MSESARITAIEPPANFRDYSAPRTHGAVFIDPPLADAGRLIDDNRELSNGWDIELGGIALSELRLLAREEILQAAQQYVRSYRDSRWLNASARQLVRQPLVMSGHQPTLFHPGVWFKNFALSDIAKEHQAVAVNLVVDNDLAGSAAIRCPTFASQNESSSKDESSGNHTSSRLTSHAVPYDGPTSLAVPYEQRWISHRDVFDSFATRLSESLAGIVDNPLVQRLWPHAVAASHRCANLGCSIAQGRHALEGELGLETLELPISVACKTRGFAAFVLGLLNELPRFQSCYNESLFEYRSAHGIRSSAHPVPALEQKDQWLEAPLWIYGDDDGRRRAAWVRHLGDCLEISDRANRTLRIERPESEAAIDQLVAAQGSHFKLRPRALVTTMFGRLVLSDLFLHGIGGAKYDQLGDRIIERFFDIKAPHYCVISATALIPGWQEAMHRIDQQPSTDQLNRELRDIRYSPELFEQRAELPQVLLERKRQLLDDIPPRGSKREWHREITAINAELYQHLADLQQELKQELIAAAEREREKQIWLSREHAFPIFPLDYLLPLM